MALTALLHLLEIMLLLVSFPLPRAFIVLPHFLEVLILQARHFLFLLQFLQLPLQVLLLQLHLVLQQHFGYFLLLDGVLKVLHVLPQLDLLPGL